MFQLSLSSVKHGLCGTDRLLLASVTSGRRFELTSRLKQQQNNFRGSVHIALKYRECYCYLLKYPATRLVFVHTDIPLVFLSLFRVFVVAVRNFRPMIWTSFLINLLVESDMSVHIADRGATSSFDSWSLLSFSFCCRRRENSTLSHRCADLYVKSFLSHCHYILFL